VGMEWTRFSDLNVSSGFLLLIVLVLWALLAVVMYWAFASGSASMKEDVKYKYVEDDQPIARTRRWNHDRGEPAADRVRA